MSSTATRVLRTEDIRRFEERQLSRVTPRLQVGLVCSALLFLLLFIWDEAVVPGGWTGTAALRVGTASVLILLAVALRTRLLPVESIIYLAVTTSTGAVMLLARHVSDLQQAAGASLTLLLMILALLTPSPQMAVVCAGLVLSIGNVLAVVFEMSTLTLVSLNLFAGSAAVVAVLMSRVNRKLELRTFALELTLEELATKDSLTGALNRRAFTETGERTLRRARHDGQQAALILLDLDHFKQVNDTRGHAAGDEALRAVVRAMVAQLRPEDPVGRLGGEELAVLLADSSTSDALAVAERLRTAIESTQIVCGAHRFHVTTSIGVALSDESATLASLLSRADGALYRAKAEGRNRVELATIPRAA